VPINDVIVYLFCVKPFTNYSELTSKRYCERVRLQTTNHVQMTKIIVNHVIARNEAIQFYLTPRPLQMKRALWKWLIRLFIALTSLPIWGDLEGEAGLLRASQ